MDVTESVRWAERLKAVVPWGSSTCSKSPRLMPEEPGVIVRGKGCRVWDADGREFIDYRSAVGPVTLGYCYPAVDDAIRRQMEDGINFGQPHPVEGEVAELLCEVVPCAERARFLKTGGEAMAACFKLARYHTGRDHVIQIGYNGWLNSLASGTRVRPSQTSRGAPPGVPGALSDLHHSCGWNAPERVEQVFDELDGQVAALAIASDYRTPEAGRTFYPFLREITERHGIVLIFDEIVTGFRVATAGVQEYFGVTPDLAVFAKGIANGMPLAAYVGRADVMEGVYKAVVSSTYGGEALSLAAAKACIEVYRDEPVIEHLRTMGIALAEGVNSLFEQHGVALEAVGYDASPTFVAKEDAPAGLMDDFMRAAYAHGVSLYAQAYPTYSHTEADMAETLERLDAALQTL